MKTNITSIKLRTWLFNKPVFFALSFFILSTILFMICAAIQTFLNFETMIPAFITFVLSFVICTYYVIKKLPHEQMNQNDFVAITNGASIISIITSLASILFIGVYGTQIKQDIMRMYFLHRGLFACLLILFTLIALYLIGLTICNIYAKYKRATTIGISPWRVILSMPFGFLLMWTPGYLIKDKVKNNMEIKSQWFSRFNKLVLSNSFNTLYTFLFFVLCKGIIAGLSTFILTCSLLIIYALWYIKHKSDFVKNINNGYALSAVGINVAILLAVLIQAL